MAFIIGTVTDVEEKILKNRGWKIEEPPKELQEAEGEDKMIMIYVDNDILNIVSGSDWST